MYRCADVPTFFWWIMTAKYKTKQYIIFIFFHVILVSAPSVVSAFTTLMVLTKLTDLHCVLFLFCHQCLLFLKVISDDSKAAPLVSGVPLSLFSFNEMSQFMVVNKTWHIITATTLDAQSALSFSWGIVTGASAVSSAWGKLSLHCRINNYILPH